MWQAVDKPNHMELDGARDVSMSQIAAYLSLQGALDRPMVDQTGLTGTYDFSIRWTKETGSSDVDAATDPQATTFLEALREQLGMTLVRTTAPLSVPVIDHIERPSEN
jgi:bla regulator protein BlaR1